MSTKYEFALVDAFTDKPLSGNPCAIVFGADALSDLQMLAIAREMNQSETSFLMTSKTADLKARYFTPEREIPLAGHPTIASIHAALETRMLARTGAISLELKHGPIKVEVEPREEGSPLVRMFQRKPEFLDESHDPAQVMPIFGLTAADLKLGCRIETVSTGTPQMMIPVTSLDILRKVVIDGPAYKAYRKTRKLFNPHLFCTEGVTPFGQTFARHPGTPPDTLEDAFTGSATGGMAAFLWKYGLIPSPKFVAEQGHWMNRPGMAWVEVIGPANDIQSVSVAGTAVTVVRGELTI